MNPPPSVLYPPRIRKPLTSVPDDVESARPMIARSHAALAKNARDNPTVEHVRRLETLKERNLGRFETFNSKVSHMVHLRLQHPEQLSIPEYMEDLVQYYASLNFISSLVRRIPRQDLNKMQERHDVGTMAGIIADTFVEVLGRMMSERIKAIQQATTRFLYPGRMAFEDQSAARPTHFKTPSSEESEEDFSKRFMLKCVEIVIKQIRELCKERTLHAQYVEELNRLPDWVEKHREEMDTHTVQTKIIRKPVRQHFVSMLTTPYAEDYDPKELERQVKEIKDEGLDEGEIAMKKGYGRRKLGIVEVDEDLSKPIRGMSIQKSAHLDA